MIFFKASESIFEFLGITISFYKQIVTKIFSLFKKIVKKCWKRFFYVINFSKYKCNILHKKTFLSLFKRKKKGSEEVNEYETEKV